MGLFGHSKKNSPPLTSGSIPDLKMNSQQSYLTSLPQKGTGTQKVIFGIIFLVAVGIAGFGYYYVNQNKTQTTDSKAAPPPEVNEGQCSQPLNPICIENTIGEVRDKILVAGGVFKYWSDTGQDIVVSLRVTKFYCPDDDGTQGSCPIQIEEEDVSATLAYGDRQVEIVGEFVMDSDCGSYQIDTSYSSSGGSGPAGSLYVPGNGACGVEPTPSPSGALPTSTPIPTTVTVALNTPVVTATPPFSTPTTISTPTPIVVVNNPTSASTSNSVSSPTSAPTAVPGSAQSASDRINPTAPPLPEAGTPLSIIAIGIPFLLLLLALIF